MAEALWLVTRTIQPGDNGVRNGVHAVVINNDDGDTAAVTISDTVARLNAQFGADAYPAGYFDSAVIISNLTTGPLQDDQDCYVVLPREVITIESTV
jgi:hypothetical protein